MYEDHVSEGAREFASKRGVVGGRARAEKLSSKRRSEIARKAAAARVGKRQSRTSYSQRSSICC